MRENAAIVRKFDLMAATDNADLQLERWRRKPVLLLRPCLKANAAMFARLQSDQFLVAFMRWRRMMLKFALAGISFLALTGPMAHAQQVSPNGVKTLSPAGAIKPTGTWNLGTRAGDFVYVAGMRGIDPKTDTLVQGDEARVRQAFMNMQLIAE